MTKEYEIEWCNEPALAIPGHGLDETMLRARAEHHDIAWPADVDEVMIVQTPDKTGQYGVRWHVSESKRARPFTILWNEPKVDRSVATSAVMD